MIPAGTSGISGRRILIVEDEYFLAQTMRDAFADEGAEVVGPVPTVEGALDLIEDTDALDAAVLDLNLQGEMAYPVADALRGRGIPFVFATGYDASAIDNNYLGIGRCEKPVDPAQVAHLLFG